MEKVDPEGRAKRDRLRLLRYDKRKHGPTGYRLRMGALALLPFAPFVLFDVDPQASGLWLAGFLIAVSWSVVIYGIAIRELWASIWRKPE